MYCHNPDTWEKTSGDQYTIEDVIGDVLKYKSFHLATGGGITISGGEPFTQSAFLIELLKASKAHGIHTIVDTSGYARPEIVKEALQYTDLLMLDVKAYNPETYKKVTGVSIDRMLQMLRISQELNVPTWARYVLVPELTDNIEDLKNMEKFLRGYSNVKKVEVLPFHKAGEYKWAERNIPYELTDTQPPAPEILQEAKDIFKHWQ